MSHSPFWCLTCPMTFNAGLQSFPIVWSCTVFMNLFLYLWYYSHSVTLTLFLLSSCSPNSPLFVILTYNQRCNRCYTVTWFKTVTWLAGHWTIVSPQKTMDALTFFNITFMWGVWHSPRSCDKEHLKSSLTNRLQNMFIQKYDECMNDLNNGDKC